MAALFALAPASFLPGFAARATVTTPRAGPAVAHLDSLSSLLSAVPSGFEFAVPPAPPKFSHALMEAVGAYILLSGACTFAPILKRKLGAKDPALAVLASVPSSRFGWLQADLRRPLPPLEELTSHPIGVRGGRTLYLCRACDALRFSTVERSADFSDFYGESIYICSGLVTKAQEA